MGAGLITVLIGIFAFMLGGIVSWLWLKNNESNVLSRLREKQVDYDNLSIDYDGYRRKYLDLDDQYGELQNLERTYRVAYEDWKARYENLEKKINSGKVSTSLINVLSPSDSKKILENTATQKSSVFDLSESEVYSKYEDLLSQKDKLDKTIERIRDESEDLRELSKTWKAKAKKFKKSSTRYKDAFKGLLEELKDNQDENETMDIQKLQEEIEVLTIKNRTIIGHLRKQTSRLLDDLSVENKDGIDSEVQTDGELQTIEGLQNQTSV